MYQILILKLPLLFISLLFYYFFVFHNVYCLPLVMK